MGRGAVGEPHAAGRGGVGRAACHGERERETERKIERGREMAACGRGSAE